jgi:Spy/CpxP family protein refolding chaperone
MKLLSKHTLLAALLASAGLATLAQTPPPPPQAPGADAHMSHRDPAQWQAHMAQRRAEREAILKAELKLTPAQEGAWSRFTAAMQPPPHKHRTQAERAAMRVQFASMTTPERIDKMRAMGAERTAAMNQRADAVKAFYAALSPDQQKVFDAAGLRMMHGGGHRDHQGGWNGPHRG